MSLRDDIRREERNAEKKDGQDGNKNNFLRYGLALLSGALAASAIWYFGYYSPEYKSRILAQRSLNNTRQELLLTQGERQSLSQKLSVSDSLQGFYSERMKRYASEAYLLRREIKQITVEYDSTRSYLEGAIALVSDSLAQARQKKEEDSTKLFTLEARLNETRSSLEASRDSTNTYYQTTKEQSSIILQHEAKIQELTPPNIRFLDGATGELYAQTSQERGNQGFGFGLTKTVLGGSVSGIGLGGDVTFYLDEERTDKSLYPFLYIKDKRERLGIEFGGGVNIEAPNSGKTHSEAFVFSSIKFDVSWVRGLALRLAGKGIKNRKPSLRFGLSFGLR